MGGGRVMRGRERLKPKNDDYRYPSTHPVASSFFNLLHFSRVTFARPTRPDLTVH